LSVSTPRPVNSISASASEAAANAVVATDVDRPHHARDVEVLLFLIHQDHPVALDEEVAVGQHLRTMAGTVAVSRSVRSVEPLASKWVPDFPLAVSRAAAWSRSRLQERLERDRQLGVAVGAGVGVAVSVGDLFEPERRPGR